ARLGDLYSFFRALASSLRLSLAASCRFPLHPQLFGSSSLARSTTIESNRIQQQNKISMSSPLTEDLCFSPDDYDDNPDQEDEDGGPNHKKRKQVKRACFSCRKAHARTCLRRPIHSKTFPFFPHITQVEISAGILSHSWIGLRMAYSP